MSADMDGLLLCHVCMSSVVGGALAQVAAEMLQ